MTTINASKPVKAKTPKPHVCGNCAFAHWPGNRGKVKAGNCIEVTGTDFMQADILRKTKACGLWKERPVRHRKPETADWLAKQVRGRFDK